MNPLRLAARAPSAISRERAVRAVPCTIAHLVAGACLLFGDPDRALAQRAEVETDHVFVFVSTGATIEADSLGSAGFIVGTQVSTHTGLGTASRSMMFENGYLELIWWDPEVSVSAENREMVASWKAAGVSPFGLGLRRVGGGRDYGVPATPQTWEWMEPGSSMDILNQPSEPHAFRIFVVPEYMAVPAWIDQVRQQAPGLLAHPNGARRLTGLEIHGPAQHNAVAARSLQIPGLRVVDDREPLLVLELDGAAQGVTLDLRPTLPVVIRR